MNTTRSAGGARLSGTRISVIIAATILLQNAKGAVFTVATQQDAGLGSLRQAMLSANALPGPDEIRFNIPGTGPHIIVPLTELPALIDPVIIDGTTQPGYSGTPIIALDGSVATGPGLTAAIRIVGGNSTVRGLRIYGFGSLAFLCSGISMEVNGNNVIEANYIGVDFLNSQYAGNSVGIECRGSSNNRIGGPQVGSRNVVSANLYGIEVVSRLIGTIPPTISPSVNNLIQGNLVGIAPNGSSRMDNLADGIWIDGGQGTRIIGNQIGFNLWHGIRVTGTNNSGNTISQNRIYNNNRLGINLQPPDESDFSVTPNDATDSDTGPNGLQNFPVIDSVQNSPGSTTILGALQSRSNRQFVLEFFRSTSLDPSGYGEGEFYVGSMSVTTDSSGNAPFNFSVSGSFSNQYFTATATDQQTGDTSEFSQAVQELRLSITRSGNAVELSFPSEVGQNYRLELTSSLNAPTQWIALAGAENVHGTGGILRFQDAVAPQTARCYRVRVLP